jgi:hypothetical protein
MSSYGESSYGTPHRPSVDVHGDAGDMDEEQPLGSPGPRSEDGQDDGAASASSKSKSSKSKATRSKSTRSKSSKSSKDKGSSSGGFAAFFKGKSWTEPSKLDRLFSAEDLPSKKSSKDKELQMVRKGDKVYAEFKNRDGEGEKKK